MIDALSLAWKLVAEKGWEAAVEHLDNYSVETFLKLEANLSDELINVLGCTENYEGLFYTSWVEYMRDFCTLNDGAVFNEVPGGTETIIRKLLRRKVRRTNIIYDAKVVEVDQSGKKVQLKYKCNDCQNTIEINTIEADYVVMTATAPATSLINFVP